MYPDGHLLDKEDCKAEKDEDTLFKNIKSDRETKRKISSFQPKVSTLSDKCTKWASTED